MGILKSNKPVVAPTTLPTKRRSLQADFSNLKPLKPGGTIGFTGIREDGGRTRNGKSRSIDDMESDDEDEVDKNDDKIAEPDGDDFKGGMLSPDDAKKEGALAEGVKKIRVRIPPLDSVCSDS